MRICLIDHHLETGLLPLRALTVGELVVQNRPSGVVGNTR